MRGNQDARKHGYYSHRFSTQELADLVPLDENDSLDDELALACVFLTPATHFEQAILHHYEELQRDYEDLKKRVDWLIVVIIGAALTSILETLFSGKP